MESINLVKYVAEAADDKKAQNIKVLDLTEVSTITDYFVICTGSSATQTKAIADNIEEKLEKNQSIRLLRREGYQQGNWILLDYGSVVVHIFKPEEREFYNIERLWGDARLLEIEQFLGE
ncbi:MAG: ribosome silencing factor [Peptococcaceae bacterium]